MKSKTMNFVSQLLFTCYLFSCFVHRVIRLRTELTKKKERGNMSSGVAINLMGRLTKTHTHSLVSVPGSLGGIWESQRP